MEFMFGMGATVRVRKGNRAGGTLVGYIWLLHSIVQEPAPFLWLMHTEEAMLRQMEKYIIPLMEACPPVKALMPTSASQSSGYARLRSAM